MKKIIVVFVLSIFLFGLTSCNKGNETSDNLNTNNAQNMNKIIEKGSTVSLNYIGTLEDGSEFDNSYKRGEPLSFTAGAGQMIAGFDAGVIGMKTGEKKTLLIEAKDAYGEYDEAKKQVVPKTELSSFENAGYKLEKGEKLPTQMGMLKIIDATDKDVTLDLNHELAGKKLKFDIEIVEVK